MNLQASSAQDPVPDSDDDEMTMAELLDQSPDLQPLVTGALIKGTLVSIASNELLVDIGSKAEGIIKSSNSRCGIYKKYGLY